MRIVFLNLYSQKIARGAESFAHDFAAQLEKRGHKIVFIKGDSDLIPPTSFSGSFFNSMLKRLFLDKPARQVFWFTLKNLPTIWKHNPEVTIPLNGFWQMLLLKIVQVFKGYKIIITGHSGPGWDERWNLYLKPSVFVASTKPAYDWAKKTCPWTRVELIPYGIAPDKFNEAKTKHKTLNIKNPPVTAMQAGGQVKKLVLCPSALVPYKRVDLAIKAVAELESVSLLVLGKGALEDELKRLGKRLLGDRFELKAVPYDQMPTMYAKADVVTLPSAPQENSPMVFIESLAAGKPVVTTDAPRARWMLEDAGFFVDPSDTKAYAKALKLALSTKVDTHKPLQKFLWENVIGKYEKLFKI